MSPVQARLWLRQHLPERFFAAMADEPLALRTLARNLDLLGHNQRILLAEREDACIFATLNTPGSIARSLDHLREKDISFALFAHSETPLPGSETTLEIHRYAFGSPTTPATPPRRGGSRRAIAAALREIDPEFPTRQLDRLLAQIRGNAAYYLQAAPPHRIARMLSALWRCNEAGGMHLRVEAVDEREARVVLALANPPQRGFLPQLFAVFNRLDLGVQRAYCFSIANESHPYLLANIIVRHRDGRPMRTDSAVFAALREEVYATQILDAASPVYRRCVLENTLSGAEAALANAFSAFCHTTLGHNLPDRFDRREVQEAILHHPALTRQLLDLFALRFDPLRQDEADEHYPGRLQALQSAIESYDTGHRHLDELRRSVLRCALLLVTHTLKTNFFVPEKQALALRLDPTYLKELPAEATADLPPADPYRITFFFARAGFGYHVGFSDIARGGWRTIIARSDDDLESSATTLFRETFVLAHTQHLKNKDIYEGGSKMAVVLNTTDLQAEAPELATWRLYKLQYGIAGAFFDLFTTAEGRAIHPAVVDHYGHDEPIELGPDENMHDRMVEAIARLARQRGYILGTGVISSKAVGINHKEFGVTSTGVLAFVRHALADAGVDIHRDRFSLKMTGGPGGDVAGNALRLILERSPGAEVRLIVDGTAALHDPAGIDKKALAKLVLNSDLDRFDPESLGEGAVLLYRSGSRRDGLQTLYKRISRKAGELTTEWVTTDAFSREYSRLVFTVEADLFLPAGGRPETITAENCRDYLRADGTPSAPLIVEGANSFLTPAARDALQEAGVLILRDASANKCGVISSSYEVIANLLLSDAEFLARKKRYVADVLDILERRATDEARLILRRRQSAPSRHATEITEEISTEINAHYARLYAFFSERPELGLQSPYLEAVYAHLPKMIRQSPALRRRIERLPQKVLCAILAAELATSLVYREQSSSDLEEVLRQHLRRHYAKATKDKA